MPCARESQGLLEQKREAPRRLTHRTLCNALKICKLGGGTSESSIEYLDVSGEVSKQQVVLLSTLIKIEGQILPTAVLVEIAIRGIDALRPMIDSINQIAVNSALEVNMGDGNVPISSLMEGYDSIPRITKEQFYTLE